MKKQNPIKKLATRIALSSNSLPPKKHAVNKLLSKPKAQTRVMYAVVFKGHENKTGLLMSPKRSAAIYMWEKWNEVKKSFKEHQKEGWVVKKYNVQLVK